MTALLFTANFQTPFDLFYIWQLNPITSWVLEVIIKFLIRSWLNDTLWKCILSLKNHMVSLFSTVLYVFKWKPIWQTSGFRSKNSYFDFFVKDEWSEDAWLLFGRTSSALRSGWWGRGRNKWWAGLHSAREVTTGHRVHLLCSLFSTFFIFICSEIKDGRIRVNKNNEVCL